MTTTETSRFEHQALVRVHAYSVWRRALRSGAAQERHQQPPGLQAQFGR